MIKEVKGKIVPTALVIAFAGATLIGRARVYAQDSKGIYPVIVQKLVEKFGI